ncbi:unnamed protein product, partial [Rotaria magnacalcarata]
LCEKLPTQLTINSIDNNRTISNTKRCFTIGQCHMTIVTTNKNHIISFEPNNIDQLSFSSINKLLIAHNQNNASVIFSSIINTKEILIDNCYNNNNNNNKVAKRNTKEPYRSDSTSSTVITFNSSSYIDYHSQELLDYPLRLSLRFRTLGRISNGVLLSLTQRKSSSLIIPFFIIEHSNGKIEITVLQLDERKILSTVTERIILVTTIC